MKEPRPDEEQVVERARQGFEIDLFAEDYVQVHSDERHLSALLGLCQIVEGGRYLDLGTGNGYVAFELANRKPQILITGSDIVSKAVDANRRRAELEGHHNLDFVECRGTELPFGDGEFFGVVSRYAFHHFPNPRASAAEISRVLRTGGFCVIADPVPDALDEPDFINRFAGLKNDGHVRFHMRREIESIFADAGFALEEQTTSSITFHREVNEDYERLLEDTAQEVKDAYGLRLEGNRICLTVEVLNTRFRSRCR